MKNILIQIFTGEDREVLEYLISFLLENIPQAICIGTTTDGEVYEDCVSTFKSVISISVFEKTTLKTAYINLHDSFQSGEKLAQELVQDDTKLLILFTDGTHINAEEFLNGISSFDKNISICGGMAGDNGEFIKTYISSGHAILSQGAVGVSLNSSSLQVATDYKFDWKAIGIEHVIEEVIGNRIYKIDGMKPIDFYGKYLGSNFSQTEFPLIVEVNGEQRARAVIAKHEDGSLSCGGNLKKRR